MLGAYLVFGIAITIFIFIKPLDSPAGFFQEVDNVAHLGTLRTFAETGNWSSISRGSFYPSGWYTIGAIAMSILPIETTVATIIADSVLISCVFSSGMFLLMKKIFPENKAAQWFGILVSFAFVAFPWTLLIWGPLHPFLCALSLSPALASLFMTITSGEDQSMKRVPQIALFVLMACGVAFSHTSAIFVLIVFLTPYCCSRILAATKEKALRTRLFAFIGFIVLVVLVWTALFFSPLFKGVVNFNWAASASLPQAIWDVLSIHLKGSPSQPVLAVLILVGVIALLRTSNRRWLVASYLIACIMYVFDVATDGFLKQYLTGFWFTDQRRTSAIVAFFAIPVVAYALSFILAQIEKLLRGKKETIASKTVRILQVIMAVLVVVVFYLPTLTIAGKRVSTPLGSFRETISGTYSTAGIHYYDSEEQAFVEEAKKLINAEGTIANIPTDGSVFLYAINGLPALNSGLLDRPAADSAKGIIRLKLNQYADDEEVQQAVRDLGIRYVIQLDYENDSEPYVHPKYDHDVWAGINGIDENTPGFKLIAKKDDMRLYEIEDVG